VRFDFAFVRVTGTEEFVMLRHSIACMVLTVALASAASAEALPRVAKSTPYAQARAALTKLGYKPEKTPDADACDAKSDATCFPERVACAGSGLGQCIFLWSKNAAKVEIVTVGERPIVERVRCQSGC
jgi:hypothetical protein